MRATVKPLIVLSCLAVAATPVWGEVVELPAVLDGTLYQLDPARSNGIGPHIFVGRTAVGDRHRAVMAFNFSSIPAGSTVTAVALDLTLNKFRGGSLPIVMHRVTRAWGEGTSNAGAASDGDGEIPTPGDVTWTESSFGVTAWTTPGGDYVPEVSATTSVSGTGLYTWSGAGLVADVQGWLAAPSTNHGWLLRSPETVEGNSKRFVSGDSTNTFQIPVLRVTYTPPAASCPADLDNGTGTGTPDGGVDVSDLLYFLSQFEAGAMDADLDNGTGTGTPDGGVDVSDLLYFLVRFEGGC